MAGNSGSVKSAIIQHIALQYRSQDWVVKLVNSVNEIKEILISNSSVLHSKTVFVLNDPFGKIFFDELAYNSWETHEETLRVSLKKIKLLLSCRKYILYDDRVRGILSEKSNIVDIDNNKLKLNKEEKQNIWNMYAGNMMLTKKAFKEIFKVEKYFPLLCKLYSTHEINKTDDLLKFFKEPIAVVEDEIRSFRKSCKEKYCALVLLVLLNNAINVHELWENKISKKKI